MSKFNTVLNAIEIAKQQAKAARQRQEQANQELVRKWQELTRQRVSSYERGWV